MEIGPLPHIDVVTSDDLAALGEVEGPCVSIYLPTHRYGPDVRQGPIRLRNLLSEARDELGRRGWRASEVDGLLAPLDGLAGDVAFWQYQGAGLALFRAPDHTVVYRLPLGVDEQVAVGDAFRLAQLVPLVSGDGTFFVLALSQKQVRLFEATRHHIGEVDLGDMPRSIDEALAYDDRERQLQLRSTGSGAAMFHGHGVGDEVDKVDLERYLRVVAAGVHQRLAGARDHPLVLAAVGYYLPIFAAVSDHPVIVDRPVEGNPERRSAEDLHAGAWPLVEPILTRDLEQQADRYREAAGTGLTSSDLDEIVARAAEGRVDTLFVAAGVQADARVSDAILATLRTSGRLLSAPDSLEDVVDPVAALLRY